MQHSGLRITWPGRRAFFGAAAGAAATALMSGRASAESLHDRLVGTCPATRVPQNGPLLLIAHHGATRVYPENTIESCAWALNNEHATALEVDLCMSKDGQVFLWHDWDPNGLISVSRQLGLQPETQYGPDVPAPTSAWRVPVDQLSMADIRATCGYKKFSRSYDTAPAPALARDPQLPTLREFMDWARAQANLRCICLDIKMPPASASRAPEMLDAIHSAIATEAPDALEIIIMVPDEPVLKALVAHDARMNYGLKFTWDIELPPVFVSDPLAHSAIDHAATYKLGVASIGKSNPATILPWRAYTEVLDYDFKKWSASRTGDGGQGVKTLIAWTLNDPTELACLVNSGVTGIITDDIPALRRAAMAAQRAI